MLLEESEDMPTEAGGGIVDLNEISMQRLQKMMEEGGGTGGFAFLDEESDRQSQLLDRRAQSVCKYKESLLHEYEEEMRRKQYIQQFKAAKNNKKEDPLDEVGTSSQFIPKTLGKSDPALNKMTKDEIRDIHSRHKRDQISLSEATLKSKEEFEVNEEDSDDDFAGPSLALFDKTADMQEESRNRKQNDILTKVQDVVDEEVESSFLPISHEVVLSGHSKSI